MSKQNKTNTRPDVNASPYRSFVCEPNIYTRPNLETPKHPQNTQSKAAPLYFLVGFAALKRGSDFLPHETGTLFFFHFVPGSMREKSYTIQIGVRKFLPSSFLIQIADLLNLVEAEGTLHEKFLKACVVMIPRVANKSASGALPYYNLGCGLPPRGQVGHQDVDARASGLICGAYGGEFAPMLARSALLSSIWT